VNYDPLLAKVTAAAESRTAAISRAAAALRAFPILGIRTNLPFLIRVIEHPDFAAGRLHTGFIEEHAESLLPTRDAPPEALAVAAVAPDAVGGMSSPAAPAFRPDISDPWSTIRGWGR
jgi:acetyl/propionyl-CoA carboxylase alpha subunit